MATATFGKYRLLAELGHGGMADVFLAVVAGPVGSGFSKLTVVKRLRHNLAEDPEFVAMLLDEARISARLNHPNVVQTNEIGEVDGVYFIAMEYLDGQPLHRVQSRVGNEQTPTVTKEMQYLIIADALAGLHHAHELRDYDGSPLQIVHRDVTPHNIFVTYDGQVKVVDFGIAKAVGRASETRHGVVKGKVRYMAPEQAIGIKLDRRADVFSMAVLLWEVAAGRRMWKDLDEIEILQGLVSGSVPASPRSINPDVPEEIDRICRKALACRADDRYATAEDFRTDLEQYLADSGLLIEVRRKLGPAIGDLFKDRRVEIKEVIERQLTKLSNKTSGEFQPAFIAVEGSGSRPSTSAMERNVVSDSELDVTKLAVQQRSLSKAAISGALLAVLVVGGGFWAFSHRAPRAGSVGVATIDRASEEEIEVSFTAEPPSATITLDHRKLGSSYSSRLPRDRKEHRVEVSADGFVTKVETVTFDGPLERRYQLEKAVPSPGPTVGPAKQDVGGAAARAPIHLNRGPSAPAPRPSVPAANTAPPAVTPAVETAPARPQPAPDEVGRKKRHIDNGDPWGTPSPPQ